MNVSIHGKWKSGKDWSRCFSLGLIFTDYTAILAAEILSVAARDWIMSGHGSMHVSWLNLHVFFPLCFILCIHLSGLYWKRMQFWEVITRLFKSSIYGMVMVIMILYFAQIGQVTSRLFVALLFVFVFLFLVLFRFILKKIQSRFGIMQLPVLLMGAGKTAAFLVSDLERDSGLNYKFIGFLEDNRPDEAVKRSLPWLGGFADAKKVVRETGVKNIIVMAPGLPKEILEQIVYDLQPLVKNISFIPDLGSLPVGAIDITSLADGRQVAFRIYNRLSNRWNRFVKYIFDMVSTGMGVICISPLVILIALLICADSRGNIIFKHKRIGKGGKEFYCYKFRSMYEDAPRRLEKYFLKYPEAKAAWEKNFKLKHDPRVTRVGRFLRRTSLDELPQVFNVLRGEMSLVGPRPIIKDEIPKYGKYINDYLMVRPGITGMWQTSGRSDVDYEERVQMDTWYVRNWNFWFDIVLLWRTMKVVLLGKGAY